MRLTTKHTFFLVLAALGLLLGLWLLRGETEPVPPGPAPDQAASPAASLAAEPLRSANPAAEPNAPAQETRAPSGEPLFRIRGALVGKAGVPLAGGVVRAYRGEPDDHTGMIRNLFAGMSQREPSGTSVGMRVTGDPLREAAVDATGRFELTGLPVRDVRLTLDHPHYALVEVTPAHVPLEQTEFDLGTLEPYLGVHVKGRIEGVERTQEEVVLIGDVDPTSVMHSPDTFLALTMQGGSRRAKVTPDHTFEFRAAWPTPTARLLLREGGRFGTFGPMALSPGETREVVLVVAQGAALSVLVRGAAGELLPNVKVTAEPKAIAGQLSRIHHRQTASTNAEGAALLEGLIPGAQRLTARAHGWREQHAEGVATLESTAEVTMQLSRGGMVEGTVVGSADQPVAQAHVATVPTLDVPMLGDLNQMAGTDVLANAATNSEFRTDAQGRFQITGIGDPDSPVTIVAIAEGYVGGVTAGVAVGTRDAVVKLEQPGRVTGRAIHASTRAPLPTVAVETVTTMMMFMERPTATTNLRDQADGRFTLDRVPPGKVKLVLRAPGCSAAEVTIEVAAGQTTDVGDVEIEAAASVRGRVVTVDGNPVAAAVVRRFEGGPRDHPMLVRMLGVDSVKTDAQGGFSLDGLHAGRLRLIASAVGYASGNSERLTLTSGQTLEGVEIRLGHGGAIEGRLVLPDGLDPTGWQVIPSHPVKGGMAAASPRPNGAFRLENLDPGTYDLQAFDLSGMLRFQERQDQSDVKGLLREVMNTSIRKKCTVIAGETVEVILDARAEGEDLTTLAGQVLVGEEPLDDGWLEVTPAAGTGDIKSTWIERGKFEIPGMLAGKVRLQVRAGMMRAPVGDTQLVDIPATDRHEVTVRLPAGEIQGQVLDDRDGQPLRGALVRIVSQTPSSGAATDPGFSLTDATGKFVFRGLAAGSYTVIADDQLSASGHDRVGGRLLDIVLVANERRSGLVLRARSSAGVKVAVIDELGQAQQGVLVAAVDLEGKPFGNLPVGFTDHGGNALLPGLPSGTLRVLARTDGYSPTFSEPHQAVAGQEEDVTVVLRRGTTLAVTVRNAQGGKVGGVQFAARRPGQPWIGPGLLPQRPLPSGDYDLGVLEPGEWEFSITLPTGVLVAVKREVPMAARATLVIDAP